MKVALFLTCLVDGMVPQEAGRPCDCSSGSGWRSRQRARMRYCASDRLETTITEALAVRGARRVITPAHPRRRCPRATHAPGDHRASQPGFVADITPV